MDSATRATDGRSVLEDLFAAQEAGDLEAMRRSVHDDIVMEWPQSGERFRGVDNAVGALTATETKPEIAGEPRITGAGGTWVAMIPLRYESEIFHYVGVFEIDEGRIRHTTEYFGAPFPAQAGRARFAEH